jgi:hypothetical protein
MKTKDAQTIEQISMDDLARVIGGADDDSGEMAFRLPRFSWPRRGKPGRGGGGGLPIPGGGGNRQPDPDPGDNNSSES